MQDYKSLIEPESFEKIQHQIEEIKKCWLV